MRGTNHLGEKREWSGTAFRVSALVMSFSSFAGSGRLGDVKFLDAVSTFANFSCGSVYAYTC